MNAWSHLPNAQLIDRVIKSVKDNPEVWAEAWNAARDEAWNAARYAARDEAWYEAWYAARYAARDEAWYAAWNAARDAARDAIAALVAWDDSTQFLEMTSDELEVWARLSNNPGAILLLPAVKALERIKSLETV